MAGWGLVPFWLKPDQLSKQPYATINARSDRIETAPAYREPFKKRRCIVPATGWYEWQKTGAKTKKPFHFQPKATPFAFGGVFDVWKATAAWRLRALPSSRSARRPARSSTTTACRWCWRRRNSTIGCGAARTGGWDDEALRQHDRGVGSWHRRGQREEQSAGADGAGRAAISIQRAPNPTCDNAR